MPVIYDVYDQKATSFAPVRHKIYGVRLSRSQLELEED